MEYKNVSEQALREAGKIIIKNFHKNLKIKTKRNWQELVTNIDLKANDIIISHIRKNFPDHGIVSEESDKKGGVRYTWFIDPLDGTTNYVTGIPFFCTSLALLDGKKPILGMVYNPITDEMFCGITGKGAWLNGKKIKVSENKDIKATLINYCHTNRARDVRVISKIFYQMKMAGRDFRRLGSAGLDICWVACGRNDVWFHTSTERLWDILPGYVIAKEAGAKITDWQGKEWLFDKSKNILITNGRLHGKMLKMLCKLKY
ncbi:MAG: inositol monophosphatase family protein [Candidatus Aenigmatarchaeota archaeon]